MENSFRVHGGEEDAGNHLLGIGYERPRSTGIRFRFGDGDSKSFRDYRKIDVIDDKPEAEDQETLSGGTGFLVGERQGMRKERQSEEKTLRNALIKQKGEIIHFS